MNLQKGKSDREIQFYVSKVYSFPKTPVIPIKDIWKFVDDFDKSGELIFASPLDIQKVFGEIAYRIRKSRGMITGYSPLFN